MDCEKVELPAEAEDSLKAKEGAADTTDINEQIVSQATAILIQLTHENFDCLAGKFVNLPFEDNEEKIGSVIRVLVEKPINELSLTSIYAKLVREICKNSSKETYFNIFRVNIMDECRKEFQKSSTDKTEIKEIEIAIKETNDESKKESLKKELEEKRAQMERRTRGNVNFIRELYSLSTPKLKTLPRSFIVEVVEMLLSLDELNLECLCKLLTNVGLKFEKHLRGKVYANAAKIKKGQETKLDPDPKWFDEIFKKLYEWSKEESLSSQVRFALLDVLRMDWKSRRDINVNTPEGSWRSTKASPQPPLKQTQKIVKIGDFDFEKVELNKAENPLKPRRGAADTDIIEQIVSRATAILNQLTHENFDTLAGKFVSLPFEDNEERIGSVVHVLVGKAINAPSLTSTCARLVREICKNSSKETYFNIFRVKMMDECRKEFQKTSTDKTEINEIEIAIKETNDESKKESLKKELEEKREQMGRRTQGNVNFIGELYTLRTNKLKLLPPCFMVEVVNMLLSLDELGLECLCKFLTTVGFRLKRYLKSKRKKGQETKLGLDPKWFDEIFKKLEEWRKEKSLSSQVRLAILGDVLREDWKSRRDVNTPEGSWRSTITIASPQPPSKRTQKIVKIGDFDFEKVELHKAENPWKPRRGTADNNINEEIMRQTRGILNKMTPHNFDKLVGKFFKLPLEDNDDRISSVVRVVFEQSSNDRSLYVTGYAKLAQSICQTSQETCKIFRKKILDQCQKEFLKTITDEIDIMEIETAIEKTDDVSKKESLKNDLEEKRIQMRRKSLGKFLFIGELYKLQMLTPRIMIDCATMLLSMDEVNLECLCKLLTTVGLKLEEQIKDVETSNEFKRNRGQEIKFAPEPNWFDKTFNKLYDLSREESLSSRIRFALLDVHELRQNNWKPRHNANAPETIDEVRRDDIRQVQEEKRQINSRSMSMVPSQIRGAIKKPSDWNTVPSNKSSRFRQKQSGDQHSGSGSLSTFLSPSTSWRSRPSPISQFQMLSQSHIEKLPLQPNLPARCGSNFEVLSAEKKAIRTRPTPTRAEIVKSLPVPQPQTKKNAQQNVSSIQKPSPIPQLQMLSLSQSPIEKLPSKPTLPSRCGSNFEAFSDENKALPRPTTPTRAEIVKSLPAVPQSNKNAQQNVQSSIRKPTPIPQHSPPGNPGENE